MEQLAGQLGIYGPLGIMCVVLLYAVIALYRNKDAADRAHQEELARLQESHRKEMDTLIQRHVVKAENWAEKGVELASKLNAVLESVMKRSGRIS